MHLNRIWHDMALSIHDHSRAIIRALAEDYYFADEADIVAFLERYPSTVSLLFEIRGAIRRFFGEDHVRLEVFRDPEWPDDAKLVVNILTYAPPRQTLDRLDQLDGAWLEHHGKVEAPLIVSIALQRHV